jgi:Tfp pilus assembly protein PilW
MRQALNGLVRRVRRVARDERGLTLVELMITIVTGLIVVVGPLSFMIVSINQQNTSSSRSFAARQAEQGLERFAADLRQAQEITDATGTNTTPVTLTATSATFYVPIAGSPSSLGTKVVWTCTVGGSCTRKFGSASAVPVITGVTALTLTGTDSNGNSATSNPTFVDVNLSVQGTSQLDTGGTHVAQGITQPIVLRDGIELRNYS